MTTDHGSLHACGRVGPRLRSHALHGEAAGGGVEFIVKLVLFTHEVFFGGLDRINMMSFKPATTSRRGQLPVKSLSRKQNVAISDELSTRQPPPHATELWLSPDDAG